ncbi:MAG: NADH-quinone oxidoreductase subunit J [Deltaproteobacteria bacterium]|jgi:NADH-quinone oxidoreductase subunit J|nr:NADH-quinone oxidoreductase subunit J [Deltaproteobacteria bacterium]
MMEFLAYAAYCVYLVIIIAGSALAVFSPNLVRAFIGLIATLFGVAGMYLLLQSPFLAFMQLLIYIGAVSVLIFFALMLTNARSDGDEAVPVGKRNLLRPILAAVLPVALLTPPLFAHPTPSAMLPELVSLADIGRRLMEDYVLPFELISIVLLVSMAGGVFLAMNRRNK